MVTQDIKYIKFNELDSTQSWAHSNPSHWNSKGWTAITAVTQSAGRGSGSSDWLDVPGGSLLMTLVSPNIAWTAPYVFVRHAQASLCVVEWLGGQGYEVQLKWPNDLYLNRVKLGGFLTEAYWQGATCVRWFLGIGLNISQAPVGFACLPGLELEGLAERLSEQLVSILDGPVANDALDRYASNLIGWRQLSWFRDLNSGETFAATPKFLSPDGRLGIQLEHGSVRWVGHKELEWLVG